MAGILFLCNYTLTNRNVEVLQRKGFYIYIKGIYQILVSKETNIHLSEERETTIYGCWYSKDQLIVSVKLG